MYTAIGYHNSQLVLDNSHLQAQKFGANLIQDDNKKKTLYYTGLPTYNIFSTLFDLLQPYSLCWPGTPSIDECFAVLIYFRLHKPMDDLAYRFKISKSRVSHLFHSWMDTMYCNLQHLLLGQMREFCERTCL